MNLKKIAIITALASTFSLIACGETSNSAGPVSHRTDSNGDNPTSSSSKGDKTSSSSNENSGEEAEVKCDLDYDSNTWSYEAKTIYEESEVSAEGITKFSGSTAVTLLNITADMGSSKQCKLTKTLLSNTDISEKLPAGTLPEGTTLSDSEDDNLEISTECEDSVLKISITKVYREITPQEKKSARERILLACNDIEGGHLDYILEGLDD